MNCILTILLIVVVPLLIIYLISLINGSASEGFQTNGELIIAKASWCPHCIKAMPIFDKLVKESPIKTPNGTITVKLLDDKQNAKEISELDIQGFPSIILMNGGIKKEYSGERSYDGIMNFLKSA